METTSTDALCPRCGQFLPEDAPHDLCPACLLALASQPPEPSQPPGIESAAPALATVAAAFPQLEILECIGMGGMGVVYKVRQPHLDRFVALKLLPQTLALNPDFAQRFNREARVHARLSHPNIVAVHDFGHSGGFYFLLMEFVDGINLRQAMRAGRFSPEQALFLVPRICEALQYAHDEGVLHRDIKPENILLDSRGRVKIVDFGISKLVKAAGQEGNLTATGVALGSPHYMAPEQLEAPQSIDNRADIYSLGVVFYEMLTGELPIGRFSPPSQKSPVDPRIDRVVLQALEKEREKRFRSAGEVKTSVEAISSTPPVADRKPAPANPAGSPPASFFERSVCYFNTPEKMRSPFPGAAARVYLCKGELQLGAEMLTFVSSWRTSLQIPLRDIRELSIGQFQMWTTPWVMKYARISFISVTFERASRQHTVLLTPADPGMASLGEINDHAGRWFERIQHAAATCLGAVPKSRAPHEISISAERAWGRKGWPLFFFTLAWCIGGFVLPEALSWEPSQAARILIATVGGVLLAGVAMSAVGFLVADRALKRGQLDLVTSEDPDRGILEVN